MKQKTLLTKLYRACVDHDDKKIAKLKILEFQKILKRKAEGKSFTTRWMIVNV